MADTGRGSEDKTEWRWEFIQLTPNFPDHRGYILCSSLGYHSSPFPLGLGEILAAFVAGFRELTTPGYFFLVLSVPLQTCLLLRITPNPVFPDSSLAGRVSITALWILVEEGNHAYLLWITHPVNLKTSPYLTFNFLFLLSHFSFSEILTMGGHSSNLLFTSSQLVKNKMVNPVIFLISDMLSLTVVGKAFNPERNF